MQTFCAVWCVTGNNVAVSRDMVRRCYRVRIDPRCAQPHLRKDFKHPNLIQHCRTERLQLLAALLVMIRFWYAAGKPPFGGTPLGTYTAWKETVGGVLKCAGFEDFLGNQRALHAEMDQESEEWETLWLRIRERTASQEFNVRDPLPWIESGELALPPEVARICGQTTTNATSRPNAYFTVQPGNVFRHHCRIRYGPSEVYLARLRQDRHTKVVFYAIRQGR